MTKSGRPRVLPMKVLGVDYWRCARCREYLPPSRFNRCSSRPNGLQGWCQRCMRAASERNLLQRRIRRRERELAKMRLELEKT